MQNSPILGVISRPFPEPSSSRKSFKFKVFRQFSWDTTYFETGCATKDQPLESSQTHQNEKLAALVSAACHYVSIPLGVNGDSWNLGRSRPAWNGGLFSLTYCGAST